MGRILSDARYALRAWARAPAFTLIPIASIGLGIGANSAIFTLVDQVILRLLPVPDPRELVQVTYDGPRPGGNWGDDTELSHPMYSELRDNNQVFSGMLCRFGTLFQIAHDGRTEQVAGELVSGTYFPVLGVGAARGRTLTAEDDRLPGGHPVAVLSHGFWTSRFGADPAVISRSMVINGDPYTIVAVVGDSKYRDVREETERQLFFPYLEAANARAFTVYVRTSHPPDTMFGVVRRIVRDLDPTVPVTAARTLDRQVAHSLRKERLVGTMSAIFATLATLLAVVGLYGVVAYTVTRRTREFGIRIALGARPADVGWMVVREGLTIATAGIAAALPAAWGLSRLVASQLYGVAPIDPATIAGAVVLLGVVSALAGLVPSSRAARIEPTEALRYE